ncbi:MAG: hypothetical protein HYX60_05405 [Legionella longbeachae]|nr:hypothetical protein [Legionella longbeachae]
MFNNRIKIDNSSFNAQLGSTIYPIDLFYREYQHRLDTLAGFFLRKDILEVSKNILDILRYNPPKDTEDLKNFLNEKINKLKSNNYNSHQKCSLIELIENIFSNLECVKGVNSIGFGY